jgi:hypothetical protein
MPIELRRKLNQALDRLLGTTFGVVIGAPSTVMTYIILMHPLSSSLFIPSLPSRARKLNTHVQGCEIAYVGPGTISTRKTWDVPRDM